MDHYLIFKSRFLTIVLCFTLVIACKTAQSDTDQGYTGQGETPLVSTKTKPVQRQWRGTWTLNDSTVFFSNDFDGARLNGVVHDSANHYTLWFTAENTPINPSPWYGFKVWSTQPTEIALRFTYDGSRSRYYPKLSRDGKHFTTLDSTRYQVIDPGKGDYGIGAAPGQIEIRVPVDSQPTWITAQELYTSSRVREWVDSLATQPFIQHYPIGQSREGRPMEVLEIREGDPEKAILVISRQHPPEVTGFLAMKSFIETLAGNSEQAREFRQEFAVFNVPMMNPDGVDNGHWRHNVGGIDLNRDWQEFNQPETRAVRDLLEQKTKDGYEFVFGADFHSTWDDIYYPLDSVVTGKQGKIVYDWIAAISKRLPQKKTNISASDRLYPTMVSRNHFFAAYDMPAIVFELGDNTPRDFLNVKGQVAAEELMRLLLESAKP